MYKYCTLHAEVICIFIQFLQANGGIVPEIIQLLNPSKFIIH
jgi:hypothetical protein